MKTPAKKTSFPLLTFHNWIGKRVSVASVQNSAWCFSSIMWSIRRSVIVYAKIPIFLKDYLNKVWHDSCCRERYLQLDRAWNSAKIGQRKGTFDYFTKLTRVGISAWWRRFFKKVDGCKIRDMDPISVLVKKLIAFKNECKVKVWKKS